VRARGDQRSVTPPRTGYGLVSGSRGVRDCAVHDYDAIRWGGRGYDVRLELHGSTDSIAVGLEDRPPPRSVEPGAAAFPAGPPHAFFLDRFADAFRAELAAFLDVVAARRPSLHGGGRSEDSAGRRGLRPLADRGPAGADRRGPPSTGTPVTGRPGPP
jgi:hypothetical protein